MRAPHAIIMPGLRLTANPVSSHGMHRDHHRWYSYRLNRDMGVAIYGNYGAPVLAFPTSCGDEWEMEGQSMIRTLSPYIEQGRIRIWNLREERRGPLTVLGHSGNVAAMLFLNENRLVSGGSDGSLLTWDLGNTSAPVLQAHVGDQGVLVIVRGSQGKMLIVGSYDGQISFWNVSNLTEERSRLKMDKPILAIAVATQSPRFAVSENGRTTLWDLNGNEYRATTLASVGGRVLYLSPDGTEVFGESGPGKVAFWHSDSPRPYREFLLDATMSAGVYSPARKQIVTWGDSVVIWNLDEDAWAPAVSRKANRAFRAEEVERYLDLERKPKQ